MAAGRVATLAVRKGAPVVACTYNEPTVFAEYALDVAIASRKTGVRTVVVSNGAIREEPRGGRAHGEGVGARLGPNGFAGSAGSCRPHPFPSVPIRPGR